MNDRITPITDHRGSALIPEDDMHEPLPSSIVLTQGLHGTAWQRFFSDGLWHPVRGGSPKTWGDLLAQRNLVLVYDATPRETGRPEQAGAVWRSA